MKTPDFTLGIQIGVALAVFVFSGYKLDLHFQSTNFQFTLGGLFLAIAYMVYEIWKIIKK